jgi:hypothetical protein
MGAIDWGEKNVVSNVYNIAGSITVATVVHFVVFDIEQFLNFPRNSLALL